MTDNDVLTAIAKAARDPGAPGHDPARRIQHREHFRVAHIRQPDDPPGAMKAIAAATAEHFGENNVRYGASPRRPDPPDFPVRERDGRSFSSLSLSDVLRTLPASRDEYVFVAPEIRDDAKGWIENERERIIEAFAEAGEEEVNP
jgi:GrpB-like predicted nucleotidyltransferase (UPF0157 family)